MQVRLGIGCGREWNGAGQPFEIKVMGIMGTRAVVESSFCSRLPAESSAAYEGSFDLVRQRAFRIPERRSWGRGRSFLLMPPPAIRFLPPLSMEDEICAIWLPPPPPRLPPTNQAFLGMYGGGSSDREMPGARTSERGRRGKRQLRPEERKGVPIEK